MRGRKVEKNRKIPEALGNRLCGVRMYIFVLVFDAVVHTALFFMYVQSLQSFFRLFLSFIFFIYPLYYVADILWSLRPSVCDILSGRILINRKYYMNTAQREVQKKDLLPVTVSVPVYTEHNEIIFETLRESLAAVKRYREVSKEKANVLVSDDGLAPLLGGTCTEEKIRRLIRLSDTEPSLMTGQEKKALERILFYSEHGIAFVARPETKRPGLFKKASNLNYTMRLGNALSKGACIEELIKDGGDFEDGYAQGDISTHEIILLLDKDSGVKEKIMEVIVPEFSSDEKLAYVQCATDAKNLYENYYTYATGHQINNLFHNIWPCKALQGFFVPLVGHNVFLRKSILEKSGLWPENRVSEDYDRAIRFYGMGYHGKYAQLRGLEFTEYASRTFTEETGKQRRYAYGLFEMMFDGTVSFKKARGCDVFYMFLYFFSVVNQVMLLPTVLFESYFGNIHLLWAGFLLCSCSFVLLPLIRGFVMRKKLPKEHSEKFAHTFIVALSFVGHSSSFFAGACRYLFNKVKKNLTPFPSTNVDQLGYRFTDGVKLLGSYIRKNLWFPILVFFCLDRGIFLLTRKGLESMTVLTYGYILFCVVLVPVLLTPQLFSGLFYREAVAAGNSEVVKMRETERNEFETWEESLQLRTDSADLSSVILNSERKSEVPEDDVILFLESYKKTLQEFLPKEDMLKELFLEYSFESCIKKDPEGKKELYLLRRKENNEKALLRITRDYPQEDALEEARLLSNLHHKGIPKVFATYEQKDKKYLIREYIEGRSLYDIVNMRGSIGVKDIFSITLKLVDILSYLHSQSPPVIHRDIKPQNIIVSKNGEIYLIDFGIARTHKDESRQDTSVVLTLDYASPEQYGFEQTTPLSDIYSLGVVLLFLATGQTSRSELEAQIVNNKLRNLIEQCISFNPKARIQSVEEIRSYILQDNSQSLISRKRKLAAAAFITVLTIAFSTVSYGMGFVMKKDKAQKFGYEQGYGIGYTDGYKAVPAFQQNEPERIDKNGNRFGNLAAKEGSFAAENEDGVFYIADDGIFHMSANGSKVDLLVEKSGLSHLSCYNGWLYYSAEDQVLQTNVYTKETNVLYDRGPAKLYIGNGEFYLLTSQTLYQLDVSSLKTKEVIKGFEIDLLNIDDRFLFFTDKKDGSLYRTDRNGERMKKLLDKSCGSACLYGDYLFCSVEEKGKNSLIKIETESGEKTVVSESGTEMINVTEDGIFFIDSTDERMIRCSFDGRIKERVTRNRSTAFNISGGWIFYRNKEDKERLWGVRLDGANDHPLRSKR